MNDELTDELAKLRDLFLDAVPAALEDDRFAEMIGSPLSVAYRVRQYFEQLPKLPQPDWSGAPPWAMWWAVDASGRAYWHEEEPDCTMKPWWGNLSARSDEDCYIDIPIGIDWRLLKEPRP